MPTLRNRVSASATAEPVRRPDKENYADQERTGTSRRATKVGLRRRRTARTEAHRRRSSSGRAAARTGREAHRGRGPAHAHSGRGRAGEATHRRAGEAHCARERVALAASETGWGQREGREERTGRRGATARCDEREVAHGRGETTRAHLEDTRLASAAVLVFPADLVDQRLCAVTAEVCGKERAGEPGALRGV